MADKPAKKSSGSAPAKPVAGKTDKKKAPTKKKK
jgi:hypothetical protein